MVPSTKHSVPLPVTIISSQWLHGHWLGPVLYYFYGGEGVSRDIKVIPESHTYCFFIHNWTFISKLNIVLWLIPKSHTNKA